MLRFSLILLVIFTCNVNANAVTKTEPKNEYLTLKLAKQELEKKLFGNVVYEKIVKIESINVITIEEEVILDFNPSDYLPANFVASKGMFKLDWDAIELIEIEEDINLDFDTKDYLPTNFTPAKGLFKLDWNKIELIEVEEELDLGINPKEYLPKDFNPYEK